MAQEIQLTNGLSATVDDEDVALVNQFRWFHRVASYGNIYAERRFQIGKKQKNQKMHQLILGLVDDYEGVVDHKDGNRLNNRRSNLRLKPPRWNARNRPAGKRNKMGLKGVFWNKGSRKWQAYVHVDNVGYHLGFWESPEEAHAAYRGFLEVYYEADYDREICPNKGKSEQHRRNLEILHLFKKDDQWKNRRVPPSNSTSGYVGVSWNKSAQRWTAYATINCKLHHIGCFNDPAAAYIARCAFLEARLGPDHLPELQLALAQNRAT
jgi:hypothetical protein